MRRSLARNLMLLLVLALLGASGARAATAAAASSDAATTADASAAQQVTATTTLPPLGTTVPGEDSPIATNDFMDLERDLGDCISAVPKPGCGREPTQAGDRGGSLQLALFGVMMLAMIVIGLRVASSVRARDRAANPSDSSA